MSRKKLDFRADAYRHVLGFVFHHWSHRPALVGFIIVLVIASTLAEVMVPVFSGRIVDAIAGDAALFRIRLDRPHEKERILSGGALIGLAFDGEGRMVVASNDTVYRFAATAKPPAA